jgi:hypothetical protein
MAVIKGESIWFKWEKYYRNGLIWSSRSRRQENYVKAIDLVEKHRIILEKI